MQKLVIVESPNKIKAIKSYLGDEYEVLASVGHIYKLKTSGQFGFGIDMDNWEPLYSQDTTKKEVIKQLKSAAKKADLVYIATDPDREGEAIGANLVELLGVQNKYERIKYNEITKEAILNSLEAHLKIDENLVNAQKTRRMIDRIVGFRLSNLLAKKISNAPIQPSAGRVQSVALKLVIDREDEILAFIPKIYYTLEAIHNKKVSFSYYNNEDKFEGNAEWIAPEKIEKILSELKGDLVVVDKNERTRTEAKITPFKQSVLFKKAGLAASTVQDALQRLYEGFGESGGLISYPRTDSTRLSASFVQLAKKYVLETWGPEYVSATVKGDAGDQDAHEAIRPTNPYLTPQKAQEQYNLSSTELKVYTLIYNTTLQAIMEPPKRTIVRYDLENNGHKFKYATSRIDFDGYYKLFKEDAEKEFLDPGYKIGDTVSVEKYKETKSQTKPVPRYNEGTLIEKLDEIKVGRPSTFASTVKILKNRKYVETENKALIPTEFGRTVLSKLFELDKERKIINEGYTAEIESELDSIAEGQSEYKETMTTFWTLFRENFENAAESTEKTVLEVEKVGELCPNDNAELVYRYNKKNGQRFIACSSFPACRFLKADPNAKPVFRRRFTKKEE
ncbi:type I DNA topoisomerase [Mycoplasma procyoni]|uniref:type I DNA topoisomerase n=1 Tax=Mycoplasma procyoni TaxID=568784 RepID=UPI00197B0FFA|nr:type I DNA topoisomerase [Mycoplasma procyoni]MBN3534753.1 type I DNA topoisomerase [Mycoplasma procyoni]